LKSEPPVPPATIATIMVSPIALDTPRMMDAVMPVMGGEALYEALRQVNPKVKALVMSGYRATHDLVVFRERGLRGFVQKPFSFLTLGRAVRQALKDDEQVCV